MKSISLAKTIYWYEHKAKKKNTENEFEKDSTLWRMQFSEKLGKCKKRQRYQTCNNQNYVSETNYQTR